MSRFDTELALVVAEPNRGWILDGICRDTAARLAIDHELCYLPGELPRARAYFFSHWSLALDAHRRYPIPRSSRVLAFFTHPRDIGLSAESWVRTLNQCDAILSMASIHTASLVESGVRADRISTVLGAADPQIFQAGEHRGTSVGLVSAYYERKEPSRILNVARALPHRRFLLVGRGWEQSPIWSDLQSLPNLEVVSADYADYPDLYRQMAVYVSPSSMEGGPMPLIEAMLTDVTPVVTRTGFAPDVVRDGQTGYLCEVGADAGQIAGLIETAFVTPGTGIRESVEHLTWDRYARLLTEAATGRARNRNPLSRFR